jgi:hypothetical protein
LSDIVLLESKYRLHEANERKHFNNIFLVATIILTVLLIILSYGMYKTYKQIDDNDDNITGINYYNDNYCLMEDKIDDDIVA